MELGLERLISTAIASSTVAKVTGSNMAVRRNDQIRQQPASVSRLARAARRGIDPSEKVTAKSIALSPPGVAVEGLGAAATWGKIAFGADVAQPGFRWPTQVAAPDPRNSYPRCAPVHSGRPALSLQLIRRALALGARGAGPAADLPRGALL
jgi:hypothetical protein